MSDPDLTLYVDDRFISPWVLHAMVALEEKRLPHRLELLPLPIPAPRRAELLAHAIRAKVPLLVHGALWLTESLAISEYLAETFPVPDHPRLFPADLRERALARQVMCFLRTDLVALREERPTSTVFGPHTTTPLSAAAQAGADELVRVAARMIAPGATTMFASWCIADCDLAMALMRLVGNGDPVPPHLVDYAQAQWARPAMRGFVKRAVAASAAAATG